ncbi:GNAT family N-acetyltransferase [Mesorhizobium sp. B2-1-5]|uniref:GNAT family N-acetyltransferase n=1 Tax=Mesorhizobium sp. B2-1-5 TaxID=2589969 RepID=UPI001FEE26EC|nr:GNAT family N-acetyltransferase [Mesorhizobium sp. B2-1-5]
MPDSPRLICAIWDAEELLKTNNPAELKAQNSSEICPPDATLRCDFNPGSNDSVALMAIEHGTDIVSSQMELMKLEPRHLPGALKLSQEMGWPYRLEDWEFAAMVGNGLVLERGGHVIGTAMSWSYGPTYASAGMIIVTGSAQGGGNGSRLFDGLLAATQGRHVLLNSTEEGLALYKRRGFTAWGTVLQHQGPLTVAVTQTTPDIRQATVLDLAAIQAFDERATGMPRTAMVAALADAGKVVVIERAGRVAGYAIARKFGRGYVVGPCAAESVEDARLLILAQLSKLRDQFVRIDVYAEDGLGDWLESLGLKRTGSATAMVKGQRPVSDGLAHMYALANQSFI